MRTYFNLWVVFLISGLWHGAAWNFVAWGAFHGLFLCLDKLAKGTRLARVPGWLGLPVTFVLVLLSWVLFRADTLGHALAYAGRMAGLGVAAAPGLALLGLGARHWTMLAAAAVICFGPAWNPHPFDFMRLEPSRARPAQAVLRCAAALGLLAWSAAVLATSTFNPFIYFRF